MLVILETFVLAAASGCLFYTFSFPLPWVLGPLAAIILWKNVLKRRVSMPLEIRNGGLIILGYMMGSSFTRETAVQIARFLPSVSFATLCLIGFPLLLAFLTYKPMGISLTSAILGNVPGGLSQMVLLSDELEDADITAVTYLQSIRLLFVVSFVPFFVLHGLVDGPVNPAVTASSFSMKSLLLLPWAKLFLFIGAAALGAHVAKKLRFPVAHLLGPLLVIALLQVSGAGVVKMPGLLLIPAQITMGIYMGQSFNRASMNNPLKTTVITLISNLALILFTLLLAYYFFVFYDMNITTAFLGAAPGGMSEMAVTAIAINADLSFVTAFQIFRMLLILFIISPLLKLALPRISREHPAHSADTDER